MREGQNDSPRFEWDPTFASFLLLFFLFNVGLGVFPPLLPQIMEDLRLSFAGTGLLGTAFGLFRFLADLPAGYLLERLGPRIVLHSAAGLLVLGTAVSALANSFWAMFLARALLARLSDWSRFAGREAWGSAGGMGGRPSSPTQAPSSPAGPFGPREP